MAIAATRQTVNQSKGRWQNHHRQALKSIRSDENLELKE